MSTTWGGGNNWRGRGAGGGGNRGRGGWMKWGWRGRGRGRGQNAPDGQQRQDAPPTNNNGRGEISRPSSRESLGYGSLPPSAQNSPANNLHFQQKADNMMPPPFKPHVDNSMPPPPQRKKRTYNSVKNAITNAWKKRLPGYKLYYPGTPPELQDIDKKMEAVKEYLRAKGLFEPDRMTATHEQEYFDVNVEEVQWDEQFEEKWPDFLEDLLEEPAEVVNLWGAVMHKEVFEYFEALPKIPEKKPDSGVAEKYQNIATKKKTNVNKVGRIQAGLCKIDPVIPLSNINSQHLGKFVTIRGQIVGNGIVRAVCLQMPFLCRVCDTKFLTDQPYGTYTVPKKCGVSEDCDCKGPFDPVEKSDDILMIDCRKIKVQDVHNYEGERGSVPKTIECELTNGLVHQCNTGDNVTISGVVRRRKDAYFQGEQNLHNMFIEVIAMRNHKDAERTMGGNWFSFSDKDYELMKSIYTTPELFKLLVASLCPPIYGHLYVKAALLLSLFGGTSHQDDILSRRSDINILMVGDPGIGKSQLLKIITEVAPRGVYVCGTGSTVAGLTVTLVKDGDDYSLEAGALIMGDRGICCIDEFDKMVPQHPALLEAMEQQSVSIAKSGVFRTLPARTTVIAAANPTGGHYDRCKTVSENIKISTPLLSRFDVIFILLDKADKEFDDRMVEHIMGRRMGRRPGSVSQSSSTSQAGLTLIDRLRVADDEKLDLLPHCLIRKYIAFVRQHARPKISPGAAAVLKQYYLHLRVKHRQGDSTPVTTRQLESLVRLTEARAKLEYQKEATAEHAKDVLEIFESSLSSAFDDEVTAVSALSESIVLGMPQTQGGSKSQSRNEAKRLIGALQTMVDKQHKTTVTVDEIKGTMKTLRLKASPDALISLLNNDGYLLKKGAHLYQILSAG